MDHHGGAAPHSVKRIVLPSGKTIEVVYFGQTPRPAGPREQTPRPAGAAPAAPDRAAAPPAEPDPCRCPGCGSELVQPTAWEEAGSGRWRVTLRCPECETLRQGCFGEAVLDAFDERLEAGSEALRADYQRLWRANMAAEVERFVAAVDAGAIAPEDF